MELLRPVVVVGVLAVPVIVVGVDVADVADGVAESDDNDVMGCNREEQWALLESFNRKCVCDCT